MLYKEPFVLYLNLTVSLVLFLMVLPNLLNRREEFKVRLAFFLIFFTVIDNCITNLMIFHWSNYKLVSLGFFNLILPLMFGPFIYFYVKSLLGSPVKKSIIISFIAPAISIGYGVYVLFQNNAFQREALKQIIGGSDSFYEILNTLTLIITLIYCAKAWLFLRALKTENVGSSNLYMTLKTAWAKEFIIYITANVFIFLILLLILTRFFGVLFTDMDLIGMPIFMLFVYLLISVRSMIMYTEFEIQYVVSITENTKKIQQQRLEISRDVHDNIGAQLTFIRSILDELKTSSVPLGQTADDQIEDLSNCCNDSISELRNTLWVLNCEVIYLEDLKLKILSFINKAASVKKNLDFKSAFDFSNSITLSSKQAVSMFRIVQEILNNAIKYAEASTILIELKQQGNSLVIFISDDGVGFNVDTKSEGYGLKNIQARVADNNGSLEIRTKIGEGAQFEMRFAL